MKSNPVFEPDPNTESEVVESGLLSAPAVLPNSPAPELLLESALATDDALVAGGAAPKREDPKVGFCESDEFPKIGLGIAGVDSTEAVGLPNTDDDSVDFPKIDDDSEGFPKIEFSAAGLGELKIFPEGLNGLLDDAPPNKDKEAAGLPPNTELEDFGVPPKMERGP